MSLSEDEGIRPARSWFEDWHLDCLTSSRGRGTEHGHCMNGSAAARALKEDFARMGRAEVIRLRRKLATLDAEQRAIVEGVVGNVVEALAADAVRLLAAQPEQHVVDIVVHLFGLTGGAVQECPAVFET